LYAYFAFRIDPAPVEEQPDRHPEQLRWTLKAEDAVNEMSKRPYGGAIFM
jgi:hypothetical protein